MIESNKFQLNIYSSTCTVTFDILSMGGLFLLAERTQIARRAICTFVFVPLMGPCIEHMHKLDD